MNQYLPPNPGPSRPSPAPGRIILKGKIIFVGGIIIFLLTIGSFLFLFTH